MNTELQYLEALKTILSEGVLVPNRTGISAYTYPHMMIRHDMSDGFPLLTTKKMAWNSVKVELEFFIKGLTNKQWLKDRKCTIWNEWCNPKKVPSGLSNEERKTFQLQEDDLGKIYGYQWRNFNSSGKDELANIVNQLKTNPNSRQLVCSAWNPCEIEEMGLPPCHWGWNVFMCGGKLHLSFNMRSVDMPLGFPFNLSSYALLLHLLCKESGYEEGVVTGFLSNCHIYENQVEGIKEQITRIPYKFPTIETSKFSSIFEWEYLDTSINNYLCHSLISFPIAV